METVSFPLNPAHFRPTGLLGREDIPVTFIVVKESNRQRASQSHDLDTHIAHAVFGTPESDDT